MIDDEPVNAMQQAADRALDLLAELAEEIHPGAVMEFALVGHAGRDGIGAFYGLETPEEMFTFLLSALNQLAGPLGYDVTIIDPDRN
jgi:hypothetical protein